MTLMYWWCKNCGTDMMIDSSRLKFPGDVRPSRYIENVICKDCEENYKKQVKNG